MSKAYREKFGKKKATREQIRQFTALETKLGPDGKPVYITEQGHKAECDVNNIIKKYDATGLITHVATFEASYGDIGSMDFKEALDMQIRISEKFSELPSDIRRKFENSPYKYLSFLENPANMEESYNLGLRVRPMPTPQPSKTAPEPSKMQKAAPVSPSE